MVVKPRHGWRGFLLATACAAAAWPGAANPARAEDKGAEKRPEKFEATYKATLAGLAVGTGTLVVDISRNRYTAVASGKTLGLMRALSGGTGEGSAQGSITGKKLLATGYSHAIKGKKLQVVKMLLAGGNVKQVAVEPEPKPSDDTGVVELTDAHKHGVVDPLSAGIVPAAGANGVGPEACAHKLPIFDGRMRFDLKLAYKRQETVQAEGYRGPAVVCSVTFEPIGGYNKEKFTIKYLREARDMELWLAPVAGTPFLAPYRIYVPTLLGAGVLQATRFVTAPAPPRAGGVDARAQ
jgi:hypothetical protein